MTRPRPSPRPRSSRHERSPPRTAHGPRATPPSELPETGSAPDTTAPPAAAPASLPSLHTSTIEVLRPPVEFALAAAVRMENHPGDVTASDGGGHLQCRDGDRGVVMLRQGEPGDPPRCQVLAVSQVELALVGGHLGQVATPLQVDR